MPNNFTISVVSSFELQNLANPVAARAVRIAYCASEPVVVNYSIGARDYFLQIFSELYALLIQGAKKWIPLCLILDSLDNRWKGMPRINAPLRQRNLCTTPTNVLQSRTMPL